MSSYHFEAKMIGRSAGRSVVAAAAYRASERIVCDETGVVQNYTRKSGTVFSQLMTPENVPAWARDRSQLWNAVEAKETRSNSALAREFELALPNELSIDQCSAMLMRWADKNLVSEGMCVDICIHDPVPKAGKPPNKHAHVLCTLRELDRDDWVKSKNRTWGDVNFLVRLRKSFADAQNEALEAAGFSERVSHKSLKDQRKDALARLDVELAETLNRAPEPKMGVAVSALERRAEADAAATGVDYVPVTERGAQVAAARSLRAAMSEVLIAARRYMKAALSLDDPKPGKEHGLDLDDGPSM